MKYIYDSQRILQHFANNHGYNQEHVISTFKEWTGKTMKRAMCQPFKEPNNIRNHRKIVHSFEAKYARSFPKEQC